MSSLLKAQLATSRVIAAESGDFVTGVDPEMRKGRKLRRDHPIPIKGDFILTMYRRRAYVGSSDLLCKLERRA